MRQVSLHNTSRPLRSPFFAGYCESYVCRLRGLMLRADLQPDWGLLLVQGTDSRLDASIHMLFMRMDLAAIWINAAGQVVDAQLARRWRPAYIPRRPARFVLETHPDRLSDFQIGDQITFEFYEPVQTTD
jgi:uncharacterized membrane protein (UPF0127 family)